MIRTDQRQVLEGFSRGFTRELHNLLAADLGRSPSSSSSSSTTACSGASLRARRPRR